MSEAVITAQVKQALEGYGARVHRNNVGCCKFGARWVRYGVGGNGGSDWIGWLPVRVTPPMLGKTVAVFLAVESKSERGVATPEQLDFIENVTCDGGIAGFARSWEEARGLIQGWRDAFGR